MSDLISREATIADLHTADIPDEWMAWIDHFVNVQPSVTPERNKGKWIWEKRTGTYHCSECGHDPLHEDVGEIEEYKYCMNCGAEMEVDG
jgi:tRNA G26 N,N-dimethylase Trm1